MHWSRVGRRDHPQLIVSVANIYMYTYVYVGIRTLEEQGLELGEKSDIVYRQVCACVLGGWMNV